MWVVEMEAVFCHAVIHGMIRVATDLDIKFLRYRLDPFAYKMFSSLYTFVCQLSGDMCRDMRSVWSVRRSQKSGRYGK